MCRYVLPVAILIFVPGCLSYRRMLRINPEDCQGFSTISWLVIAPFMARCEAPMPARMKWGCGLVGDASIGNTRQLVKWGLFPNVDLVDFRTVDARVNVALIVKANGGLDGVVNGELCGEVNTDANAILNAEGNGMERVLPSLSNVRT